MAAALEGRGGRVEGATVFRRRLVDDADDDEAAAADFLADREEALVEKVLTEVVTDVLVVQDDWVLVEKWDSVAEWDEEDSETREEDSELTTVGEVASGVRRIGKMRWRRTMGWGLAGNMACSSYERRSSMAASGVARSAYEFPR